MECAWSSEIEIPVQAAPIRPDGCLDIVFAPRDGLRAIGTMTVEQRVDQLPDSPPCGVRFHPGMARAFFGISSAKLTDRAVPLREIMGGFAVEMEERLRELDTPSARANLLLKMLRVPDRAPGGVERAIAVIAKMRGTADVDTICRDANISPRQFRRRCLEESGLTPKHLCRVLRFRHAVRIAFAKRVNWAWIAAEAGYFDQAHLIRDFREFTGKPPMAVFSNRGAGALD